MTKEQEEAIKYLEESILIYKNAIPKMSKTIETVLNMLKKMKTQEENYKNLIADVSGIAKELGLEEDGTIDEIYAKIKEKDKQINSKNGTINALQCALKERTEERDRKDDIIAKQNRQIDLMAESIARKPGSRIEICQNMQCDKKVAKECKLCAKQYYKELAERKSENGN